MFLFYFVYDLLVLICKVFVFLAKIAKIKVGAVIKNLKKDLSATRIRFSLLYVVGQDTSLGIKEVKPFQLLRRTFIVHSLLL